jgi:hypothetical protein
MKHSKHFDIEYEFKDIKVQENNNYSWFGYFDIEYAKNRFSRN